tara:strand:+ start:5804 stop:6112 length:309 start_codon:yes stop_codon:yes gene_type:complete
MCYLLSQSSIDFTEYDMKKVLVPAFACLALATAPAFAAEQIVSQAQTETTVVATPGAPNGALVGGLSTGAIAAGVGALLLVAIIADDDSSSSTTTTTTTTTK